MNITQNSDILFDVSHLAGQAICRATYTHNGTVLAVGYVVPDGVGACDIARDGCVGLLNKIIEGET